MVGFSTSSRRLSGLSGLQGGRGKRGEEANSTNNDCIIPFCEKPEKYQLNKKKRPLKNGLTKKSMPGRMPT